MRKLFIFKKLKKDNKGAGFFTVIVAALFLMVLSAALIYSSFTAYKVKISAKKSNSAFYYADMAIEEIKTGFQKVVSDSARAGYENVLARYTSTVSQTAVFKEAYLKSFTNFKYKTDAGSETNLFYIDSSKIRGVYSNGIKSFLSDEIKNDNLSITSIDSSANPTLLPCQQDSKGNVTIKGLKAEYTDGEYTAYITTDIKLLIPEVTLTGAYDVGGLENYVFIADGGFDQGSSGSVTPTTLKSGTNAFFGQLTVKSGRSFICEDNCKVVVGKVDRAATDGVAELHTTGKLMISGPSNTKFELGENSTLYAEDIELSEYANIIESTGCKTYVADDLSLAGESKATIYGNYIGFGNGSNSDGSNNAVSSSSVLFPKRTTGNSKATLDLSNCDNFTIAGRSYITNSLDGVDNYSDVGMGSSITSTKEQLIYLVPAEYLGGGTNPTLINGTRNDVVSQAAVTRQAIVNNLTDKTLFTLRTGEEKKASDYGITSSENVKTLIYPVVGANQQWAVYYFFDFRSSINNANNYFKDFFNSGSNDIMAYLNDYATITGDASRIFTAGTGAVNSGDEITITEATQKDLDGISIELSQVYKNLCQTMNSQGSAPGKSPFLTLVDVKHLHEIIEKANNNGSGNTDGYDIVKVGNNKESDERSTGGRYAKIHLRIDGANPPDYYYYIAEGDFWPNEVSVVTDHLIICDGDVHIKGEWRGLIICSGKVVNEGCSKVELDSETDVQQAKGANIFTSSKFYTGNAVTPNDDNWNMDDQVVFENWKKNEG